MPGVDRVSVAAFRRNWEERLTLIARRVRTRQYRPRPLRVIRVPKKKGGIRTLRIPTVADRVLQRVVFDVLCSLYEPIFFDCSFGYRPCRSVKDAVERVLYFRSQGWNHLLDADIDNFYDNIDHELLLRFVQADLPDDSLLPLISAWLDHSKVNPTSSKGLPMGSPLAPLLANIYLHRLDHALIHKARKLIRYADDFVVFARSASDASKIYSEVEAILKDLMLKYEPSKTSLASFDDHFTFLGVTFTPDDYSYVYLNKEVCVEGDHADWLFNDYGPEYE